VVRVLGARDPRAFEYADQMGIAVQLTNVLRDVGVDAAQGRIYLAREDLARLDVSEAAVCAGRMSADLRLLLALYAERARLHYDAASAALPAQEWRRLRPAEAMGRIYRDLLEQLQARGFPCLGAPLRLSRRRRLAIAAATWLGLGAGRSRAGEALALPADFSADRMAASGQR